MKKKLCALMLVLVVIAACVLPSRAADVRTLDIAYNSLSLRNNVCMKYAVDSMDPATRLLIWTTPQTDGYTYGTQDHMLSHVGKSSIEGKDYLIFDLTALSAENMTDEIYARAYLNGTYGAVKKYSILEYAYEQFANPAAEEALKDVLEKMLAYGAAAQVLWNYRTDRLATDTYYRVTLTDGGLLADGTNSGLYLTGDELELTAPAVPDMAFSGWKEGSGDKVTVTSGKYTVGTADAVLTPVYGSASEPVTTLTRGEMEKAIAEMAWAYALKGEKLQYGSQVLSGLYDKYYGGAYRLTEDAAPEYGTADTHIYSVCSDYVYKVYYEALGYRMFGSRNYLDAVTTAMWQFSEAPVDTVLMRWCNGYTFSDADIKFGVTDKHLMTTGDARAFLQGWQENLRPGDVIMPYGHALLYMGGGYVLDCYGAKYDLDTGLEKVEADGAVSRLRSLESVFLNGNDPDLGDLYCLKDGAQSKYILVFRPLNALLRDTGAAPSDEDPAIDGYEALDASVISRLHYPAMEIDRTASVPPFGSAAVGDTVTYTVSVTNAGSNALYTAYQTAVSGAPYTAAPYTGLTVRETIPAGTEFVSAAGAVRSGDTLTWTVDVPVGETVACSYTVRVTAARGTELVNDGGFVADIPSNRLCATVCGDKLSEAARNALSAFAAADPARWREQYYISTLTSGLDFAERVYEKAMGIDLGLPADVNTLIEALFERKTVTVDAMSKRYTGSQTETPLVLRDAVSTENQRLMDMLIPGYYGGKQVFFSDRSNAINEFRTAYLEAGDILVLANCGTSTLNHTQVMVYAGNGKLVGITSTGNGFAISGIYTELALWEAFSYDVFVALRPCLAYDNIHSMAYDISTEQVYGPEPGIARPEQVGTTTLDAHFRARLSAMDGWTDKNKIKNTAFAVKVYDGIGLDISGKLGGTSIKSAVAILKELFDNAATNTASYTVKKDLSGSPDLANMLWDYGGGAMKDPGKTSHVLTLSDLQIGDILLLARRTDSTYFTAVYLGDGRFLMARKYANDVYSTNGTHDEYAVVTASSDTQLQSLMTAEPRNDNLWEFWMLLRPAKAFYDINDTGYVYTPEQEETETFGSSEFDAAHLAEFSGITGWSDKNRDKMLLFAEKVYKTVGSDISGKTGGKTIVAILKELFDNAASNTGAYTLKTDQLESTDIGRMLIDYGGSTMKDAGKSEHLLTVSDMKVGDVLLLARRTGSTYFAGVYLGDGKLLMARKYSDDQYSTNGAYDEFELLTVSTDDRLQSLMTAEPRDGNLWEFWMLLRPAKAFYDINDTDYVPGVVISGSTPLDSAKQAALAALTKSHAETAAKRNTDYVIAMYAELGIDLRDVLKPSGSTLSGTKIIDSLFLNIGGFTGKKYDYLYRRDMAASSLNAMFCLNLRGGTDMYDDGTMETLTPDRLECGDVLYVMNRSNSVYHVYLYLGSGRFLISYYQNKTQTYDLLDFTGAEADFAALLETAAGTELPVEAYFVLRPYKGYSDINEK